VSHIITVEGIEAFGYHGVFPHERAEGQTFRVDVTVETDFTAAAGSDDVRDTVDYGVLAQRVASLVEGDPVNLIETLCDRIVEEVLQMNGVRAATVTVHKPDAPMPVPFSGVSVTMRREAETA
jgi:dihydroneopterin aldolase